MILHIRDTEPSPARPTHGEAVAAGQVAQHPTAACKAKAQQNKHAAAASRYRAGRRQMHAAMLRAKSGCLSKLVVGMRRMDAATTVQACTACCHAGGLTQGLRASSLAPVSASSACKEGQVPFPILLLLQRPLEKGAAAAAWPCKHGENWPPHPPPSAHLHRQTFHSPPPPALPAPHAGPSLYTRVMVFCWGARPGYKSQLGLPRNKQGCPMATAMASSLMINRCCPAKLQSLGGTAKRSQEWRAGWYDTVLATS